MIDTGAGVVDADYRGILFVLLFNHSENDFQGARCRCLLWGLTKISRSVEEGDRIAQLILERIYTPETMEVQVREYSYMIERHIDDSIGPRQDGSWGRWIWIHWWSHRFVTIKSARAIAIA